MADDRLRVSLKPKQWRFLEALKNTERYGWDEQDIVRRFVDAGINNALEKGHIKIEDGEERLTE